MFKKPTTIAFLVLTLVFFPVRSSGAGLPAALKIHYNTLRKQIYGGYLSTRNYRNIRFYVAAALHDLSSLQWKACQSYQKRYGDCNAGVTRELYGLSRSLLKQRGPGSGIRKIYDYVNRSIRYEAEGKNVPRFPYETLKARRGDCEDQAILLASLLRIVGYESALVRFTDKQKDFFHVMCVVKTNKREARTPLFRFGRYLNEGYCWKILDPSYNHPYYHVPKWLNSYRTPKGYTFPAGVTRILRINRNEYYDLCDRADRKGRYR